MSDFSKTDIMGIAAKASCDPRTVRRFLDGETVRELAAERIRAAMKELGFKAGGGRKGKVR